MQIQRNKNEAKTEENSKWNVKQLFEIKWKSEKVKKKMAEENSENRHIIKKKWCGNEGKQMNVKGRQERQMTAKVKEKYEWSEATKTN